MSLTTAADVIHFWFTEAGPGRWFKTSREFDQLCRERFLPTLEAAARGECASWRATPSGRCAEIIVLDQFSRNLYRNEARAFAQDSLALELAREAVASGDDQRMHQDERYFSYMPYMHSESLAAHDDALPLFETLGKPDALRYERAHRDVIARFGRYPGRNAALGRESSDAELVYLASEGGF
ncbi:MAG: DUF924 domain-containing protein [Gammaproteobacteria bacterium]|nr:DUF924 domain-containing protein [Gammaproteobacteria bacterium]